MSLDQLCRPRQYTPETAPQNNVITTEVTFLKFDDRVEDMLHAMATSKLNVSQIFDKLWTQHGNTVHHKREQQLDCGQLTLEDVATLVWLPAKQGYDGFCECIRDGSITLDEVDNFLNVYVDKYSHLENELKLMCTSDVENDWIKGRIRQVEQCHHLDHDCHDAKLIMDAKEAFHLTGNFTVLEAIVSAVEDKSRPLSSITDDVVSAKTLLRDVTEEKVECIRNLTKCKPLIDWLQENIHVTGYAPFIYDLKNDTNFEDFMKLCEQVWHALKNDKNLPTKLVDTFRHLDWLKNVKESHGSVELDAISQATAINDRGVYCVGKQNGIEPETVDNVVRLILMPETEDGEQKHYGFQDLQNLQSKLMLVAGKAEKGKDNVDTFTEVLDGVTRLANVYIKICASGSILFRQWVSSFFCEPGRKFNATVDFGLSDQMLQGLSQDCPTVAKQIQAMCEFLEECYTDWLKHIELQRSRFYFLNNYSTQQLVILCKEIVSLCCSDKENIGNHSIDPVVYPMLCAVKPNCSTADLGKAVKLAFQDLAEREKHANDDGIIEDDTELTAVMEGTESEQADMKHRLNFVMAMSEADFTEELANRALRQIPATEIDAGITWCMEHMDDEFSDDGEENGNTEKSVHTLFHVLGVTESFQSITLDLLNNIRANDSSLKTKLRDLWRSHLQSAATSLTDHLSLEHLGYILEALADRTDINRPMPQYLITGIPNLIVCAQADVLRAVLSLYDAGQDLPLPEADEVLLCTEQTTAEEVDLLYRRAARDKHGKIYCLAHADMLDYEVSETAESYLEKHIKGSEDCRLVVICSKEREDRSRLVTALDKHRVTSPIVTTVTRIQTYLKTHFRMECHQQGRLHRAADVDPEDCNVRIVKSDRAGVGKSLRVQRLTEALTVLNGAAAYRNCAACVTVTLQQKRVDHSDVLRTLVNYITTPDRHVPRVFHFDIARETQEGIDDLLFNLLVLGSLTDKTGYVWRKSSMDLYLIETLPLLWHDSASQHEVIGSHREETEYVHRILALLPSLTCRSPQQSLDALTQGSPAVLFNDWSDLDQLMDNKEFRSAIFQRPYQCLQRFSTGRSLHKVTPEVPKGTQQECLQCLLR
ncbi:E3 ubiquitin-protein ligase [Lamellibrachia satsuma]|nr:E3 ubiquitin-protein ligase [Lamellibrachia satsuma]